MIDILIANNNPIIAEGLKTILQSKMGNRVLGIIHSKKEAEKVNQKYFPDLIVIDFSDKNFGVDSYLLNDCEKPEILEAIEDTISGKQFYCGMVIDILAQKNNNDNNCSGFSLSQRELEIIKLISEGLTNRQIADNLFLSTHTVNTHRKNIMSKLGINNTAGIVIYAVKENIIRA